MENQNHVVCPWCDHEIVWDPEIGPESICPHCENELDGYRTIEVSLDLNEQEISSGKMSRENLENESGAGTLQHQFEEKIQSLTDQQFEAPECQACYQFMVQVGEETVPLQQVKPLNFSLNSSPIWIQEVKLDWYVCPHCFKLEKYLSQETRKKWIRKISDL